MAWPTDQELEGNRQEKKSPPPFTLPVGQISIGLRPGGVMPPGLLFHDAPERPGLLRRLWRWLRGRRPDQDV